MAIVFVSPKQRQRTFFLGITVLFVLIILVIGVGVLFAKPVDVPKEQVFINPKVKVDLAILGATQVRGINIMDRLEKVFTYEALEKGVPRNGTILAIDQEDAEKKLKGRGYSIVKIEEAQVGRENPFTPYYAR